MIKLIPTAAILAVTALVSAAPKALIAQGVLVTNYFGFFMSRSKITPPSLPVLDPNIYRGGATTPSNLNITHPTILDQLKANGLTYKQYIESYLGGCYLPDMYPDDKVTALYYKCHSPFNMIFNLRGTLECLSAIGT